MKSITKLALAAVLALSGVGIASAQTPIHVTGSTAYRVADVSSEVAICGGTGTATAAYWGSSLTGANYSIVAGNGFIFENYFNGSVAGDEALEDGVTQLGFPSYTTWSGSLTPATSAVVSVSTNTYTAASGGNQISSGSAVTGTPDTATADIAFSDVFIASAQQIIGASGDNTAAVANNETNTPEQIVGIVPFVFVNTCTSDIPGAVAGTGSFTNIYGLPGLSMDPQKFTYLYTKGTAKLSKFTGLSADEGYTVYAMGRDVDSGTRGTALAETGDGLNGSDILISSVKQYYPYVNSGSYTADDSSTNTGSAAAPNYAFSATGGVCGDDSTATSIGYLGLVPKEGVDLYTMPLGDGGFYSGGNLAKGMSNPFNGLTGKVLTAYLGASDASTALGRGAQLMSYNGYTWSPVTQSSAANTLANATLIYEGQYTYWGYEHLYTLSTNSNSQVATAVSDFVTQLSTNMLDTLSSNGVTYSAMKVSRTTDGENVQ